MFTSWLAVHAPTTSRGAVIERCWVGPWCRIPYQVCPSGSGLKGGGGEKQASYYGDDSIEGDVPLLIMMTIEGDRPHVW